MAKPNGSLQSLAKLIDQQQKQLATLRREFEARRKRLDDLNSRRAELQAQLSAIDAQLAGVAGAAAPPSGKATSTVVRRKITQAVGAVLGGAEGPMSVAELSVAIQNTDPSIAGELAGLSDQLEDLVSRKKLKKSKGDQGEVKYRLTRGKAKVTGRKRGRPRKTETTEAAAKATTAKPAKAKAAGKKAKKGSGQPLRLVLEQVLAQAEKPLTARELADRVLATGFITSSTHFANVVQVTLSRMKEVASIPGEGYRIKGK